MYLPRKIIAASHPSNRPHPVPRGAETEAGCYHNGIYHPLHLSILGSGSSIALSVRTCLIRNIDFLAWISLFIHREQNLPLGLLRVWKGAKQIMSLHHKTDIRNYDTETQATLKLVNWSKDKLRLNSCLWKLQSYSNNHLYLLQGISKSKIFVPECSRLNRIRALKSSE